MNSLSFDLKRTLDHTSKGVLIEVLEDLDPEYVFSMYRVTLPDGYIDGRIAFHKKGESMDSGIIVTYSIAVGLDVRDLQMLLKLIYASKGRTR